MRDFAELAKLVTRFKSKRIDEIYNDQKQSGTKYIKMIEALSADSVLADEYVEEIIGAERKSSTYRMFKLRFQEKLLNSILSSKVNSFANYSNTLMALSRNVYCIRVLLLFSARSSAVALSELTLKKAIEYHFAEIVLFCSQNLRRNQLFIGNLKVFNYYSEIYNRYSEILVAENKASEYYELIHIQDSSSLLFHTDYLKTMQKYVKEVDGFRKKYNTYQLNLYYFRIKAILQLNSQDYFSCLETWNSMAIYCDQYKHFEYKTRMGEILIQKMYCYLYLRDYKNGLICAKQCSNLFEEGTNNWFIYNELLLIISFHTQNYGQAGIIIKQITSSPEFKFKNSNLKERWKIFEAYYSILVLAGKAEPYSKVKFRFSSFINSVGIHTKDKKGFNASLIIVELMYYLLNKDYHIITEKIVALKNYSARHFKGNDNYRSYIFIQLMIQCEKHRFVRSTVLKRTLRLQTKLKNAQFTFIQSLDGIEIVPFMDLWKIVLGCLD